MRCRVSSSIRQVQSQEDVDSGMNDFAFSESHVAVEWLPTGQGQSQSQRQPARPTTFLCSILFGACEDHCRRRGTGCKWQEIVKVRVSTEMDNLTAAGWSRTSMQDESNGVSPAIICKNTLGREADVFAGFDLSEPPVVDGSRRWVDGSILRRSNGLCYVCYCVI